MAAFLTIAEKYWKKKIGIVSILIVATWVMGSIYPFIKEIISTFEFESKLFLLIFCASVLLIDLIIFGIWYYNRKPKKTPHGKLGILIALRAESKEKFQQLRHNFLERIKDGLSDQYYIHTLELEEEDSLSDHESIKESLKARNAVMYICCIFFEDSKDYEVQVNSMVLHKEVEEERRKFLQDDLNVLTPRFELTKEKENLSFRFSSDFLKIYAKYFIAFSFGLGNQLEKSHEIFEEVRNDLQSFKLKNNPFIRKVNEHLDGLLTVLFILYNEKYLNTSKEEYLDNCYNYLKRLEEINPSSYEHKLGMASYHFMHSRDVVESMKFLKECVKLRVIFPHHWYSIAFLCGYNGNLEEMLKTYRKAFSKTNEHQVYFSVERYIEFILDREPERYHLYLALALINDFKGDTKLAQQDYGIFITKASEQEIRLSNKILQYMDQNIHLYKEDVIAQTAVTIDRY